MLQDGGFPKAQGPVPVLVREHALMKDLTKALRELRKSADVNDILRVHNFAVGLQCSHRYICVHLGGEA